MEQELNAYLERVDRCLKPMSAWERVDIVQEIRSEILELAEQGLGAGAIIERLGAPRELAAAYLRDAIVKNPRFSWRRLGAVVAFYSLAGLGVMIVLPATSIMAVTFMLCGALVPAMALLSLAAWIVGIEVPWMVMQLGSWTAADGVPHCGRYGPAASSGRLGTVESHCRVRADGEREAAEAVTGGAAVKKGNGPTEVSGRSFCQVILSRECFPRWSSFLP